MLSFVRGSRSVFKTIALQEVLDRLGTLVASETEHTQASLVVSQIDPKIFIKADVQALVEALSNIVLNAFEMSRSQPEVQIQVSADHGQFVEIRITDNGQVFRPISWSEFSTLSSPPAARLQVCVWLLPP